LLLASFYAPVYDATLLVLSGFLVAGVVYRGREELVRPFETIVLTVYVGAMVSQPIARIVHIQVLTPILAISAAYMFSLAASLEAQATSSNIMPESMLESIRSLRNALVATPVRLTKYFYSQVR